MSEKAGIGAEVLSDAERQTILSEVTARLTALDAVTNSLSKLGKRPAVFGKAKWDARNAKLRAEENKAAAELKSSQDSAALKGIPNAVSGAIAARGEAPLAYVQYIQKKISEAPALPAASEAPAITETPIVEPAEEINLGQEETPAALAEPDPFGIAGPHRPAREDDFGNKPKMPVAPYDPDAPIDPANISPAFPPVSPVAPESTGEFSPVAPASLDSDILDVNLDDEKSPPAATDGNDQLVIQGGKIFRTLPDGSREEIGDRADVMPRTEPVIPPAPPVEPPLNPETFKKIFVPPPPSMYPNPELARQANEAYENAKAEDDYDRMVYSPDHIDFYDGDEVADRLDLIPSETPSGPMPVAPDPNGVPYPSAPLGPDGKPLPPSPSTPEASPIAPTAEKSANEKEADEAARRLEASLEKMSPKVREEVKKALLTRDGEAKDIEARYGDQKKTWNQFKKWFGESPVCRGIGGVLKIGQGAAEIYGGLHTAGWTGLLGPALFAHGTAKTIEGISQVIGAFKEGKPRSDMKEASAEIEAKTKELEKAINEFKEGDQEKIQTLAKEIQLAESKRLDARVAVLSTRAKYSFTGMKKGIFAGTLGTALVTGLPTGMQALGGIPGLSTGHATFLSVKGWMFGYKAGEAAAAQAAGAHVGPTALLGPAGHTMGAGTTLANVGWLAGGLAIAGAALFAQGKYSKIEYGKLQTEISELEAKSKVLKEPYTEPAPVAPVVPGTPPVSRTPGAPLVPGASGEPETPGAPTGPKSPDGKGPKEPDSKGSKSPGGKGPKLPGAKVEEPSAGGSGEEPPAPPAPEKKEKESNKIIPGSEYHITGLKPIDVAMYKEISNLSADGVYMGSIGDRDVIVRFSGETPADDTSELDATVDSMIFRQGVSTGKKEHVHPLEITVTPKEEADGSPKPEVVEKVVKKESKFEVGKEYTAKIIARDTKRKGRFTAMVGEIKVDHLLITNFDKKIDKFKKGDEIQIIAKDAGDPKKDGLTLGAEIKRETPEPKLKPEKERVREMLSTGRMWRGISDGEISVQKVDYTNDEKGINTGVGEKLSIKDRDIIIRDVNRNLGKIKFSVREEGIFDQRSSYLMDATDFLEVADPAYFASSGTSENLDELRAAKDELAKEILGEEVSDDQAPPSDEEPPAPAEIKAGDLVVEKNGGKSFKINEVTESTGNISVEPEEGGEVEILTPEEFEERFPIVSPEVVEMSAEELTDPTETEVPEWAKDLEFPFKPIDQLTLNVDGVDRIVKPGDNLQHKIGTGSLKIAEMYKEEKPDNSRFPISYVIIFEGQEDQHISSSLEGWQRWFAENVK